MARRDFGTIVERKGSQQYYVRFFAGKGKARRRYERPAGRTREVAKRKLREMQALLEQNTPVEEALRVVFGDPLPDAMTFLEAREPYLDYVSEFKKASTHRGYSHVLSVVSEAPWAKKELASITPAEITTWLDTRRRAGRATQTLNNYLVAISGLFRWAVDRGHLIENPARRVRWHPQGPGRETYLSAPEARALVAAAGPKLKLLVICALSTGMRRGEMFALRWGNVDLDRRRISVSVEVSKSHRLRVIPMTPRLHAAMAKHSLARLRPRRATDLVFCRPDGRQLSASTVRMQFKKAVAACGVIPDDKKPKVTMHTLRHTAASLMVAGGRTLFDVGNILGHQDANTTNRYSHFDPDAGRATIETLGKMLDLDEDQDDEDDDGSSMVRERIG